MRGARTSGFGRGIGVSPRKPPVRPYRATRDFCTSSTHHVPSLPGAANSGPQGVAAPPWSGATPSWSLAAPYGTAKSRVHPGGNAPAAGSLSSTSRTGRFGVAAADAPADTGPGSDASTDVRPDCAVQPITATAPIEMTATVSNGRGHRCLGTSPLSRGLRPRRRDLRPNQQDERPLRPICFWIELPQHRPPKDFLHITSSCCRTQPRLSWD